MIIYGDPSYPASLKDLISTVSQTANAIAKCTKFEARLDVLRGVLVETGQLEQAVEDCQACPDSLRCKLRSATDGLSEAFLAAWADESDADALALRALKTIRKVDTGVQEIAIPSLRVKVPEGFAFYSLFPEQYTASARAWSAAQRGRDGSVVVIGIPSIGTTLSAIVRATLVREGWSTDRMTVRPSGHPFDRRVGLDREMIDGARYALVVDEGPGASGSSMAAVARALVEAGMDRSRISFLPGHGGGPGPHASAEVRRWWDTIPQYVVSLEQLRWGGRLLTEKLIDRTRELLPGPEVARTEDLSGGLWRQSVFKGRDNPPPAFAAFERTKYRCVLTDGRAVLWKFVGLTRDSERIVAQIRKCAEAGWTAAPLGTAFGFVALPWIDGTPLTREALSPQLIEQIGHHIRESAGPRLATQEQSAAFERLREMLYWNTWESLGEAAAQKAQRLADQAAPGMNDQPASSYGDGRLAPHEWIRTPLSRIQKVDCAGHDCDHTMVGRQPLMWDAAGAAVEWAMDEYNTERLLDAAHLRLASRTMFHFYCAAYAAFRVGMACMCGIDSRAYREQLAQELNGRGS